MSNKNKHNERPTLCKMWPCVDCINYVAQFKSEEGKAIDQEWIAVHATKKPIESKE